MTTKIEWADEVWNPIIGCSPLSAGCDNCYAERMAARLAYMCTPKYTEIVESPEDPPGEAKGPLKWNGKTAFVESALEKPLHWKKSRRIFVCSMGDLFHESVNHLWLSKVFDVTEQCPQHTFMFLTKRPESMARMLMDPAAQETPLHFRSDGRGPLENVWLGATVESQGQEWRIKELLKIPAAVRFVSVEPMLGPVDLEPFLQYPPFHEHHKMTFGLDDWSGLDWVICGGESGPGARPIHPDWVRSLRDQCRAAEVPFFFKQWGEWLDFQEATKPEHPASNSLNGPIHTFKDGTEVIRVGKKKAGRLLDGEKWEQFPEGGK